MTARSFDSTGTLMDRPLQNNSSLAIKWPAIENLPELTLDPSVLERRDIVGFATRDLRARPFALLRSQFQRRLHREHARLVGFTSASPGAGKTFVALNLGAALARVTDSGVHLVDLDLRRGSLGVELELETSKGMSDVLAGNAIVEEVGRRVSGTNLAIYPTRPIVEGTAELLSNGRFGQLVAGLRALPSDAIVLVDLPPVMVGDDAMIALEHLDGFVLVVESGQTTERQVTEAVHLLEPTPCLGTILNRYRGGIVDSYGAAYGYGVDHFPS